MKLLAIALFMAIILAAPKAAGADAMDDYIRAEMESRRIPGLTVAVVKDGALQGRADGYLWSVDRYVNVEEMDPVVEFASGGLLSTAGDMAKFMLALGDPVLLTEARWQEMWTRPEVREGETPYGLGFGLSPYEGRRRVGHNGAAPGFASALSWFPEERVGVVVLSNGYQEPLGRNVQDLANRIAALHFGD